MVVGLHHDLFVPRVAVVMVMVVVVLPIVHRLLPIIETSPKGVQEWVVALGHVEEGREQFPIGDDRVPNLHHLLPVLQFFAYVQGVDMLHNHTLHMDPLVEQNPNACIVGYVGQVRQRLLLHRQEHRHQRLQAWWIAIFELGDAISQDVPSIQQRRPKDLEEAAVVVVAEQVVHVGRSIPARAAMPGGSVRLEDQREEAEAALPWRHETNLGALLARIGAAKEQRRRSVGMARGLEVGDLAVQVTL
mmetsp:Transcript_84856/g.214099  ORF Transcript_84856/g.214099 Transcript_84856/m.214099 type:complete len:246 (+) Transcript_84856:548-1285(+)